MCERLVDDHGWSLSRCANPWSMNLRCHRSQGVGRRIAISLKEAGKHAWARNEKGADAVERMNEDDGIDGVKDVKES